MRASAFTCVAALAVLALGGCKEQPLVAAPEILRAKEKALTFPAAYLGASSTATLHLENDASGPHRATLRFPSASAFSAASASVEVGGGELASVVLTFTPTVIGTVSGSVIVAADDAAPVTVSLTGTGLAPLQCSTPLECQELTFNPQTGACTPSVLPDGTACADACLTDSHCLSGRCVGEAVTCDGGNRCTENICEPGAGCLYLPTLSVCPVPDSPCLVPTCAPDTGCSTVPAVDGTPCGDIDCVEAHVCLDGTCQVQPVAEGAACGTPTPCQVSGACHAGVCDRLNAGVTNEAWEQDLEPGVTLHWLALSDANDDLYWAQVKQDAEFDTLFSLVSVSRDGYPRFTTTLGSFTPGQHPHDYDLKIVGLLHDPLVVVFGQPNHLAAYRQADGAPVWNVDFSDLVARSYHPEYFTGEDDVHVAQLVDDGNELVVSLIGVSHSDATDYSWGTWIRGLSWTDGSTLWEWSQDGRSRRLVGDSLGNLYEDLWQLDPAQTGSYFFANGITEFNAIVGGEVYALSPTGTPLWQHVQTRLLDIAADGNRLFVDEMQLDAGCLINQTLEYAAAGTLADDMQTQVPWANFVYDWPMLANGITYRLAIPARDECATTNMGAWMRAFNETEDADAWTFGANLYATNVSAATLSADGSVLFASSFADESSAALLAVQPDGGEAFACPVVGFSVLTEPVMQTGRWVVGGCEPEADGGCTGVVISYQMPDTISPATQGWTTSRGNMARTNRPR